jgi:hypothetical protein
MNKEDVNAGNSFCAIPVLIVVLVSARATSELVARGVGALVTEDLVVAVLRFVVLGEVLAGKVDSAHWSTCRALLGEG